MWWPALHTTVQLRYSVSEGTLLPPSLFLIFSLDIAFFFKTDICLSKTTFWLHKLHIVSTLCFWIFSLSLWCLCLWERAKIDMSFFKVSLQEYAWKCLCMHHLYLTKSVCPYDRDCIQKHCGTRPGSEYLYNARFKWSLECQ